MSDHAVSPSVQARRDRGRRPRHLRGAAVFEESLTHVVEKAASTQLAAKAARYAGVKTRDLSFAEYPERLRMLSNPPAHLTVAGVLDPGDAKIIAFAGARKAHDKSLELAHDLAAACCEQGAIVVSGGAKGIDRAAHEGALSASKGGTWAVLGTGKNHVFPAEHAPLYARIAASPGSAVLWPFDHHRRVMSQNFLARNRFMVALADVVVVIQAAFASGSRNTAGLARKTGKPLWVVPAAPWDSGFAGSLVELNLGARVLGSQSYFIAQLFPDAARVKAGKKKPIVRRSPEETALLKAATNRPEHLDELCELAGLSPPSAATALLTLALEHVLVEGPPGYYRRG